MADTERSTYRVNEVFYSPQGEGMRAGEMSCFVRFTGCNLRCNLEAGPKSPGGFDCDTEFESGMPYTADGLAERVVDAITEGIGGPWLESYQPWVVFTGGEPALQLNQLLCDTLHARGLRLAIETNGSINVDALPLDWITVSPKVAEHAVRQRRANEVKYVRGYGQGIPKTMVKADYQLISPAFDGLAVSKRTLGWCLELIRKHPEWRLSMQQHKAWQVR